MAQPEKALAKAGEFNLPVLVNKEMAMEVFQANLEGVGIRFDRVKIPSGGGVAFEVTTEDGETIAVQDVTGVILDHYPVNAYWSEKFAGQNNPPDCVAMDGKTGAGDPGGACAACPYNEWGSDEHGRGKACKNLHRVYLIREGEVFPILVALPPTSLKGFQEYMRRLANKMRPFYSVVTRIKLQKAQNKDGITYSQAVFARVADLDAQAAANIKDYRQHLLKAMRELEIAAEEYNVGDGDEKAGNGKTAAQAAKDDCEPF